MKTLIASVLLSLVASTSYGYVAAVQVFLPSGARVVPMATYVSTSDSFACTYYSMEDSMRKPKTFSMSPKVQEHNGSSVVVVPETIDKCGARSDDYFRIEVALAGTVAGSEAQTFPSEIAFQNSDTDVNEIQVIPCRKTNFGGATVTTCDKWVQLGPKRTARVQIVEQ
ncbi:hypothetical protein [Bdellovibrio sp. GT3]|uniref:hypothetical protein n=1 Tax=Bdellovibrio sp. GT3 TaxID=3136282 RepID=UPI0030F12E7D